MADGRLEWVEWQGSRRTSGPPGSRFSWPYESGSQQLPLRSVPPGVPERAALGVGVSTPGHPWAAGSQQGDRPGPTRSMCSLFEEVERCVDRLVGIRQQYRLGTRETCKVPGPIGEPPAGRRLGVEGRRFTLVVRGLRGTGHDGAACVCWGGTSGKLAAARASDPMEATRATIAMAATHRFTRRCLRRDGPAGQEATDLGSMEILALNAHRAIVLARTAGHTID